MISKVSLAFAELGDQHLDNFAQAVIDGMTGNATYPTPPVTMANLQTGLDDFIDKVTVAMSGGPMETAAKKNSRDALLGMLRQQATYVQLKCNNNPELLLSSGFEAQSTNRASVPLEKPLDLTVKNGIAGQLDARVRPVKNTNTYEGRCKLDGGDWLPSVFSTDSRHILFNGLTPGKMYTIEIRSLGGSTGQSDWSDPSSHMAI